MEHVPDPAVIVTAPVDALTEHAVDDPALNVTAPVPDPPEVETTIPACP